MAAEEWRDWRLIWYSGDHFKRRPPENPIKGSEISSDGAWAIAYAQDGARIATWIRYRMPTRAALAQQSEDRKAREAARVDVRRQIV